MSNLEKQKPHEPAKKAPQVNRQPETGLKPRKQRGFFSQLVSHFMVAVSAVIGVVTYAHWDDILKFTGSRLCSYDVFGKYATQPLKLPPIDLGNPPKEEASQSQEQEKSTEKSTEKSAEKNSDKKQLTSKAPPAPQENDIEKPFNVSLEAARKMFWAKDPATIKAYEKLIASNPGDADLQAELGNVFFKFKNNDQAAAQYLKAGKLFAKLGKTDKVLQMVKILEKISPESVKELSADNVDVN